ncbi:type II toxin-antitoxin system PemK/MazF family toxin [Clostridium butyricum]|uniref:type II toxin-antitoxin system PemK/MazF family toxin n=1 Tax=Clostridium butyricum TaxID=1492 RepID=UPI0032BFE715
MDIIDLELIEELKKRFDVKRNITSTEEHLVGEVEKILFFTDKSIKNDTVEKAINWCCYKNKWLMNEQNSLKNEFYNYERGDIIISLDLGTLNIGTEIRYPHPCVVLYDNNEDWIIVAPITAAQIDKSTGKPIIHEFEVYVEEQKKLPKNNREFHFKKKSVIQVDQIYRVSKHRAVNRKRKKIREDLLNQIDNIILQKYTPKKYKLLEKMKELNQDVKNELEEVSNENKLLIKEIEENKNLIKDLNDKIKYLEKNNNK